MTDHDIYLFKEGSHFTLYDKLGAHRLGPHEGDAFPVWAPEGRAGLGHRRFQRLESKTPISWVARGTDPASGKGSSRALSRACSTNIISSRAMTATRSTRAILLPSAARSRPETASIVCDLAYQWSDNDWMKDRHSANSLSAPSRSMKCTWDRGDGPWSGTTAFSPTGKWRRIPPRLCERNRALRTSSSCR